MPAAAAAPANAARAVASPKASPVGKTGTAAATPNAPKPGLFGKLRGMFGGKPK
jgi:hypothetical protein